MRRERKNCEIYRVMQCFLQNVHEIFFRFNTIYLATVSLSTFSIQNGSRCPDLQAETHE